MISINYNKETFKNKIWNWKVVLQNRQRGCNSANLLFCRQLTQVAVSCISVYTIVKFKLLLSFL